MVLYFLVPLAVVAFLQARSLSQYGADENRRKVFGGELARCLLDKLGASQLAVGSFSGWQRFNAYSVGELPLARDVYEGRTLFAMAQAARETVLRVQKHGRFFHADQVRRFWLAIEILTVPAWGLFLAGALFKFEGARLVAEKFFAAALLLALLDMIQGWEADSRTAALLKQTGYFEVDEMIKMRRLLDALRVEKMLLIFKGPCRLAAKLCGRKEAHGV